MLAEAERRRRRTVLAPRSSVPHGYSASIKAARALCQVGFLSLRFPSSSTSPRSFGVRSPLNLFGCATRSFCSLDDFRRAITPIRSHSSRYTLIHILCSTRGYTATAPLSFSNLTTRQIRTRRSLYRPFDARFATPWSIVRRSCLPPLRLYTRRHISTR